VLRLLLFKDSFTFMLVMIAFSYRRFQTVFVARFSTKKVLVYVILYTLVICGGLFGFLLLSSNICSFKYPLMHL